MKRLFKKIAFLYLPYKKLQYKRLTKKNKLKENSLLQSASTTDLNRHPDIFNELGSMFSSRKIRVLSFGCSTGEECQSLSEYLPEAQIVGVDVNKESIDRARSRFTNERIEFVVREPGNLNTLGKFDVILAISVLCKYPESNLLRDIGPIFPFEKYESTLGELDTLLQPGGCLFIRSSNFRFRDSSLASKYEVVHNWDSRSPEEFPKFDSKNQRLEGYREEEELFRKKA